MSLQTAVFSFQQPATTGNVVITNSLTFTPTLLLFYSVGLTADGGGLNAIYSFGATSGSFQGTFGTACAEAGNAYQCGAFATQVAAIVVVDSLGSVVAKAFMTAVTPTGFSMNFSVTDGTPRTICCVVVGGTDLINVDTGLCQAGATTIPHPFTPNAIMFAGYAAGQNFDDTGGTRNLHVAHGWATSPTAQYAADYTIQNGTAVARRHQMNNRCFIQENFYQASFSGFGVNQTTLSWPVNFAGGGQLLYIAFQVTNAAVGLFRQPGATGPVTATGLGFRPSLVLNLCPQLANNFWDGTTTTLGTAGLGPSLDTYVGADNGTNRFSLGVAAESSTPTNASRAMNQTVSSYYAFANHASPVVYNVGTITGFGSDGFTENYSVIGDNLQRYESFLALGGTGGPAPALVLRYRH